MYCCSAGVDDFELNGIIPLLQVNLECWRISLSRVINPDSVGKERTRLIKSIVLCIRELAKQAKVTPETKDLAAFIALALAVHFRWN